MNFQDLINQLTAKTEEMKEFKRLMKEVENDVPMELEDLLISLKDLKKQVKERKDEHMRTILEENVDYAEYRERVQLLKEDIANAKLELFTLAANESREKGDIDKRVVVQGNEFHLQTQKEVQVYLNGKVVK